MNKAYNELLKKSKKIGLFDENKNLFKGVFILQQRKLHDSGYRMMYIIGHTEDLEDCYLIGTYSDVIDFEPLFEKLINRNYEMCDIHLDINKNGIIHIWTNSEKRFRCEYPNVSSCRLYVV